MLLRSVLLLAPLMAVASPRVAVFDDALPGQDRNLNGAIVSALSAKGFAVETLDIAGMRSLATNCYAALVVLSCEAVTPSVAAEKPAGEWQHVDLTLYKRHLTVTLNGVKIIDNRPIAGVTPAAMDWDETVSGPILLQGDHSNASFRNMILTRIVK